VSLAALITALRASRGFMHKQDIAPALARLGLGGASPIAVGDDCAAIPDGGSFLLLAIEGFVEDFVAADPYFAGYCGVMVNLSDIAAMGGRPIAVVDAIWSDGASAAGPVLAGLGEAAARYGVPVVGGHTNVRAAGPQLAVAILGRAHKLLTSFAARPGQVLIAAIDLRGAMRPRGPYWDASTTQSPAALRAALELLPRLAESGLSAAGKDISMAGIIGTALMLCESSRVGATIDLAAIPRPPEMPLERWLPAFPSFGYLLTATPENAAAVLAHFAAGGVAAAVIGRIEPGTRVRLTLQDEDSDIWDFAQAGLIGVNDLA
jgi:AIR synthase-related protein